MKFLVCLHGALFPQSDRGEGAAPLTFPWISVAFTLVSIALSMYPSGLMHFCFDAQAIAQGEWWRLLTGHLVHSSAEHLIWDALAFFCVGVYVEVNSSRLLAMSLLAGLLSVDLLLLSAWSPLLFYCGLSGILFAPLAVALWLHWQNSRGLLSVAPMMICAGKIIWELVQQNNLLVNSGWPAYPPAHLAGIVGGLLVCFVGYRLFNDENRIPA